jgi:hypothetical protein
LPTVGVEVSAERASCAVEFDSGDVVADSAAPVDSAELGEDVVSDEPWVVVPDSGVSAHATPVPVATAAPTPNATAKAPIRPTRAAALFVGLIGYTPVG